jgi:hypothetical protein
LLKDGGLKREDGRKELYLKLKSLETGILKALASFSKVSILTPEGLFFFCSC